MSPCSSQAKNSNGESANAQTITKAMAYYEATQELPEIFKTLKGALLSIPPTSIEPERTFSSVGFFATKLRSSLGDKTLHSLVILRNFYKKMSEKNQN